MGTYWDTPGNENVTGTADFDAFNFYEGGSDTIHGAGGDDWMAFQGAFDATDKIDGGSETDGLSIDGDYSNGVVFGPATLVNVEKIKILNFNYNYSYSLTTHDNTVAAGQTLEVDGRNVSSGHYLHFDGSAETDGSFVIYDGNGANDVLIGGAQSDSISISQGGNDTVHGGGGSDAIGADSAFTSTDLVDGGEGDDILYLNGDYTGAWALTLSGSNLQSVETLALGGDNPYNISVANDTLLSAGQNLYLTAYGISGTGKVFFSGSAETDGTFSFQDSINNDSLYGGQKNDTFYSNGGKDVFFGMGGDDTFSLGASLDIGDVINGGNGYDYVFIQGDYSAGITFQIPTIQYVEDLGLGAGFDYKITLNDSNVFAGATLIVRGGYLNATDTMFIDGSKETNGHLTLQDGKGDDTLIGGGKEDYITLGGGGVDKAYGGGGDDDIQFWDAFTTADFVDGGAGHDRVFIRGDYGPNLVLGAATITNVEALSFANGFNYHVTLQDSLVAAGATLRVESYYNPANFTSYFDGSAETDGSLEFTGGYGNDTLIGGAKNDKFYHNRGDDTMMGGGGEDQFSFDTGDLTAADKIDGGADADELVLYGNQSLTFGAQTIQNIELITLYSGYDYSLTANDANVAAGKLLTVDGHWLGTGDTLNFDGSAETDGSFILFGGNGGDTLKTGAGNDKLKGGAGDDLLNGGGGNDKAVFSGKHTDYQVTQLANGDIQVKDLRAGSPDGTDTLTGIEVLSFSDGNYNAATGQAMAGQGIPDQVSAVNQPFAFQFEVDALGNNPAFSYTAILTNGGPLPDWLTFDGPTRTFSGTPPQNFIGDLDIKVLASDPNTLTGDIFRLTISNGGNDVLVSGTGTGTTGVGDIFPLIGGEGDDVYAVADETAEVTENAGEGADTVYASVTYTLPDNVEGLVLQEAGGAIDGTGSEGNDTIIGNGFTNWLQGGGGHDALIGGGGGDVLDGGAEADGMAGGMGDDTYVVDNAGDQIQENVGEGADTVYAGVSFTLPENVEGLVLMEGAGAINGAGSEGQDTIFGNSDNNVLDGRGGSDALVGGAGHDVLIGGAGVDGMAGGLGDDTYVVDNGGDQITENAGEGADTVYATASYTLAANLEGLVLCEDAGAIDGSGNSADNYVFGNAAANTLHGNGGMDVMFGGAGMDTLAGDAGNDVLTGGADNDLFCFGSGFGRDSVEDFAAGDHVVFSQAVFANFAAVQAHMVEMDATTTVIVLDNDNTLAVHHASGAVLTQNDFMFV